ncbi:MAG: methionyl-tRNA formyltransferase [Patescibacteria group bacterium]|nr:methionyl-tRNA formyltransferase [Patescibacteria group bacterium]
MPQSHKFAQQRGSLRFVYFGTPKVASDTLALLIEHGFIPTLVVTSPDAPKGRGLALTPSLTKELALAHTIPVLTPEKLDDVAIAAIASQHTDYAVVVAYGKIFPEALIATFPKGVLNVHYSLLPKYRGATPLETALLMGEAETGVTIQKMVRELDAGDILAQEKTTIVPDETARELRPRLIEMGATLLTTTLPVFERDEITPVAQDAARASRARKLAKEDGLLDLTAPAQENWNKYRAYADSIGTYFFENGKRMKIISAENAAGVFRVLRVIPEGKRETEYKG